MEGFINFLKDFVELTFDYSGEYLMTVDYVYRRNECYTAFNLTVYGGEPQPTADKVPLAPTDVPIKVMGFPLAGGDKYSQNVQLNNIYDNSTVVDYQLQVTSITDRHNN